MNMRENSRIDTVELGSRIRQARAERNMSQMDLAEACGISVPYVSDIEPFLKKGNHGLCGKGQQRPQQERRKQRKKKADCQPDQEKCKQYGKEFSFVGTQEWNLLSQVKI